MWWLKDVNLMPTICQPFFLAAVFYFNLEQQVRMLFFFCTCRFDRVVREISLTDSVTIHAARKAGDLILLCFSSAAVDGILFRFASWRLERLSASNLKFKRTLVDFTEEKSVRGIFCHRIGRCRDSRRFVRYLTYLCI